MTQHELKIATTILDGFETYWRRFSALTARAEERFRRGDWDGMQADAAERLDTYQRCLDAVVSDITLRFPEAVDAAAAWESAKIAYEGQSTDAADIDLAHTFFNSVSRRIRHSADVDPAVEFVRFQPPPLPSLQPSRDVITYTVGDDPLRLKMVSVLKDSRLGDILADPDEDAGRIARAMIRQVGERPAPVSLDMLTPVFYRGVGAYLIGRLTLSDGTERPWAAAFVNNDGRVTADGLITDESGLRILFSFTHSYFHAATVNVGGVIGFLQGMLPQRRRAELFISLGYNRHGKTELYRDLTQHQNACSDIFVKSPGQKGMVMVVFNMPSDNLVFKVIRDRFAEPKRTSRHEVIAKYDYIFRHDRTGRLPDAQVFEHLIFNTGCFHPDVLDELQQAAARAIHLDGEEIILARVYVERRVTPLDLYLQSADEKAARAAVIDFGQAIKDMAASNIFPGDLLIKNFGVTELGRVIFYDYDEVCPLTSCRFRNKPKATSYENELSSAPWFMVGDNDVFPEEFILFLGLNEMLRDTLVAHHGDLFTPEFWQAHQARIQSGTPEHVIPYQRFLDD